MDMLYVVIGLAMLIFAGDFLVKGAVALSLKLGIPAFIVSLTVVAFGTSAPELLISVEAVLKGTPTLALGNVVGSNIANVLLVLGVPALLAPIVMTKCATETSYWQMLLASVIFIGACFFGPISYLHGILFLIVLATIITISARETHDDNCALEELEADFDPSHQSTWKTCLNLLIGIIGLPIGASFLINGATSIATSYGVSEAVIGLTLVAIGTSLPELATTVMAALRRNSDVILGNVIGSNLFNLLAIIGIASFFGNIPVPEIFLRLDLWIMLGASLLLIPFSLFRLTLNRIWGAGFIAVYALYMGFLLG